MSRPASPVGWRIALTLLALLGTPLTRAQGLETPEIVERRLPSAELQSVFPPGRALATIPRVEFDRLTARLAERHTRARSWSSRAIRATHTIRWADGVLLGRTSIVVEVEVDPGTPELVPLLPWSPAVLKVDGGRLGALDDGTTVVQPGRAGRSTITLDWVLSPDPGSGRFNLGLPQIQPSRLELSLPENLVPSWAPMGPEPVNAVAAAHDGQRLWTFEGAAGARSLRLVTSSREAGAGLSSGGAWVRGDSRIDLGESGGRFRAQWLVETTGGGSQPGELQFRLSPGLILLGVEGDGLGTPQSEPAGDTTLVRLPLRTGTTSSRRVQINAVVEAPLRGVWTIPACDVVGSPWLGGRTTVVVGPERSVAEVEELQSWRVPASSLTGTDVSRSTVLAFDGFGTGPVGRLRFDAVSTGGTVEIRGQVWPDTGRLRLDAQLQVRFDGPPQPLAIDLPDDWVADGVEVETPDRVVTSRYRVEPRSGRALRVLLTLPQTGGSTSSATVRIGASRLSGGAPGTGTPADSMPRLVLRGLRVVEDAWCLRGTGDRRIRPVSASGLAWLDSDRFELPLAIESRSTTPLDSQVAFSWRWLGSEGTLDLELAQAPHPPVADCWVVVDLTRGEPAVDWYLRLESRETPFDSITVRGFGGSDPDAYRWRLLGLGEQIHEGIVVSRPPGGADDGSAPWQVTLPRQVPPTRPVLLHARRALTGTGERAIPLPTLAAQSLARGTVLVRTQPPQVARLAAPQVWDTDPSTALRDLNPLLQSFGLEPLSESPSALAQARHYGPDARSLNFTTAEYETTGQTGLIEEAVLSSEAGTPDRGMRHLRLRLRHGSGPALRIALPDGAEILRSRIDGLPLTPERTGTATNFEFALPPGPAGALRSELTLDYRLPGVAQATDRVVSEPLPQFTWPCLATLFQRSNGSGPTWEPTGGGDDVSAPRPLGSGPSPADDSFGEPSGTASRTTAVIVQLQERARTLGDLGPTLGTALQRLDGGPVPLVVDRLALLAVGLDPGTLLRTTSAVAGVPSGLEPLERAGVVFLPGSGFILVSARGGTDEAARPMFPGRHGIDDGWGQAARQAVQNGNDALDRLESVARWVGAVAVGGTGANGRIGALEAPERAWWSVQGPPGSSLRWERSRGPVDASTVILTLLGGALGWIGARFVPGRGTRVVAILVGLAVTLLAATVDSSLALGLLSGVVAGAGAWIGQRRMDPKLTPSAERTSGRWTRFTAALVWALVSGGVIGPVVRMRAQEVGALSATPATAPILVAISTDDPEAPVMILEADLGRLRALAAAPAGPVSPAIVLARSAEHSVTVLADTLAVESRLELETTGPGMSWSVPLGDAFEIRVAVNGKRVNYRFEADRRLASIELPGPGVSRVTLWRRVPVVAGNAVRVPINAVANASVADPSPSGRRLHETRGRSAGSRIELGPLDELLFEAAEELRPATGRLAGLLQWYPEPAGDRVLVRLIDGLAFRRPLRFQVERGLFARPVGSAGGIELSWEGPPEDPVLVVAPGQAALDEGSLEFELWRPGSEGPRPEPAGRTLPRLVPADGGAFAGVVSLWNADPAHRQVVSSMALDPGPGATEEQDPARLLGAFAWEASPGPTVWLQPQPTGVTVTPQVQLELEPGRIGVVATAECRLPAAWFARLQVELPPTVLVESVTADGLRGWSQAADGTLELRVQSDPGGTAPLRLRIRAHRDTPGTPLDPGATTYRIPILWPRWPGVAVETGNLLVQSPPGVTFRLERPESFPLPVPSTTGSTVEEPLSRATLAVGATPPRLDLIWRDESPRADVSMANLLVTDPDHLEWRAQVRYDLRSGPTRSLRLELPTSWADGIQVDAGDAKFVSFLRSAGSRTNLNLSFTNPMLGRREIGLTARRARPEGVLPYPDLVPLGRGRVQTTLLAWSNGSGRALSVEGSAVQEVDRSRFQGVNLPLPQGVENRFFQVARVGWKLALGDPSSRPLTEGLRQARGVTSAHIDLTRSPDGSMIGVAEYQLAPGTAPSLPIRLGPGCELLEALVDDHPTRVLREPATQICQVPVSSPEASRVILTWRQSSATEAHLPVPVAQTVDTLVRTFAPPGLQATALAPLQTCSPARYWQRALAFAADRIAGEVERFDRASASQRQQLLGSSTAFLLELRSARRAPDAAAAMAGFDALELRVADAFRLAGLTELWSEAERSVGRTAAGSVSPAAAPALDPSPRLRRPGLPAYWEGRSESGQPLVLRWDARPTTDGQAVAGSRIAGGGRAGLGVIALVLTATALPGILAPAVVGLGLLAAATAAVALNPWCLLAYVAALIVGYGLPTARLRPAPDR